MARSNSGRSDILNLRRAEVVEVCSESEILSTLDENGELDGLPFMPEMLQFCGKQFRVYRRADKTCDTIHNTGIRRMKNCVHLEELRCGGEAHGGCQARCLIFWKEAWLKRAKPGQGEESKSPSDRLAGTVKCTAADLVSRTRKEPAADGSIEPRYSCQATGLFRATEALSSRALGPYFRDLVSGNVSLRAWLRGVFFAAFRKLTRIGGYRIGVWTYNKIQALTGGCPYPYGQGKLVTTPTATLNLQPGELVQIKGFEEILATVDKRNRNRGLSFDVEMVRYCGGKYRVLQRVERIINERTGKMIQFSAPPVMLEGVTCQSEFSEGKLFCPRSIHSYWREIWLRRAE